jgi:hypothetical protein
MSKRPCVPKSTRPAAAFESDWKDATAGLGNSGASRDHEFAGDPLPAAAAQLPAAQEELAPQARRHPAVVQAAQGVRTKAQSGAARVARFQAAGSEGTPMSESPKKDELEGTEAPFVSHLIELRDRLIRAVIAIAVAFGILAFFPGPRVFTTCWPHRWPRTCPMDPS